MFLLNHIIVSPFVHIFDIISLFAAEFEEPKSVISVKGSKFQHCNQTAHIFCCDQIDSIKNFVDDKSNVTNDGPESLT